MQSTNLSPTLMPCETHTATRCVQPETQLENEGNSHKLFLTSLLLTGAIATLGITSLPQLLAMPVPQGHKNQLLQTVQAQPLPNIQQTASSTIVVETTAVPTTIAISIPNAEGRPAQLTIQVTQPAQITPAQASSYASRSSK